MMTIHNALQGSGMLGVTRKGMHFVAALTLLFSCIVFSSAAFSDNNTSDPDTDEEASQGYITSTLDVYDVAITKPLTGSSTIYENDGDVDSEDAITATPDDSSGTLRGTGSVSINIPTYVDGDIGITSSSADAPDQRVTGHVHAPTGEKLSDDGWVNATLRVDSVILPTTINFTGITVAESTGTGSKDSCYYTGATGEVPYDHLAGPGSTWFVGLHNDMGDDNIGWAVSDINFYRSHGRATCGTVIAQNMSVVVPKPHPDVKYTSHTIKLFIGKTTLTNTKDSVTDTKPF